jgi:hypothetical protein
MYLDIVRYVETNVDRGRSTGLEQNKRRSEYKPRLLIIRRFTLSTVAYHTKANMSLRGCESWSLTLRKERS